ncbi:hypothetical protein LKL35_07335 [Streptomyces sp. ET3-23]|uniref:hypothetical protein n=1 Tax=Streptomyces sp. ET3-23 TaxID=2885643 RepID=UPI001D10BF61|nr:hypothetical protein [Streptomyces sp. ET3-23]MCC2275237.1 hypothetical protein [Streptomyces sp. ET3-23]
MGDSRVAAHGIRATAAKAPDVFPCAAPGFHAGPDSGGTEGTAATPCAPVSAEAVRSTLEAVGYPLQRFDLILEVFWAAGYDRSVCRTVYDLPETYVELARLIDRMRKDGMLVTLPVVHWVRLLGVGFQSMRSGATRRSGYWYATAGQHARWRRAAGERRARVAAIAARLAAAGLPPLHVRATTSSPEGDVCDRVPLRRVREVLELVTPDGRCVAEAVCDREVRGDGRVPRPADAVAAADLFAHAPADLAFLLSLARTSR